MKVLSLWLLCWYWFAQRSLYLRLMREAEGLAFVKGESHSDLPHAKVPISILLDCSVGVLHQVRVREEPSVRNMTPRSGLNRPLAGVVF